MRSPLLRWTVAVLLSVLGATTLIYGLILSTANPRTNAEDDVAWTIFAIGSMILGAGSSLPIGSKINWSRVVVTAFLMPICLFTLIVAFYWLAVFWTAVLTAIGMNI